MNRIFSLFAVLSMTVLCSGCWLLQSPESRPEENYDLSAGRPAKERFCRFDRIRNLSPAGREMQYRHADNRITEGPASWVQVPEALLQRYLGSQFQPAGDAPRMQIAILRFELDNMAKQAVLQTELQCFFPGKTTPAVRSCILTAPLENTSGAAAARAMSECAEKLTDKIQKMIQEK